MRYPQNAVRRAPNPDEFQDRIEDACRSLLEHAPDLPSQLRQLLQDYAKGRYQLLTLRKLMEASAYCSNITVATALPEAFRAYAIGMLPQVEFTVLETYTWETHANAATDVAQGYFLREPSRGTRDGVREALRGQIEISRLHLDAIEAEAARARPPLFAMK